ncbi:MAG: hypothetical protein COA58_09945 [Bacteroidetes bacterium]|nr:MAG: hypothetical protein COA58_09945 [Bacteroidota bacterium]
MFKEKGYSDDELVKMILKDERSMNIATSYILKTHGKRIKLHILEQSESMEEAEDVLYEGLAAFIMNVRKGAYRSESPIRVYITSICRRIWFKKFKRMMLHKKFEEYELEKPKNLFEDHILTNDMEETVEILMSTLKKKCQDVLHLWALSFSMVEIATKLKMSSSQVVMNRKNLCLKELRSQIESKPHLAKLML